MSGFPIVVITGTRAEFGLLQTVLDQINTCDDLQLVVIATGTHLLPPSPTIAEVRGRYGNVRTVEMQRQGETGRLADARALGRGISRIAEHLAEVQPACVVVLGDRIEAFAGASAASIGGFMLAHLHGGDRAEGIADEAIRHAITKLAHLHLPATQQSADRIIAMGEDPNSVHVVGSPAVDGIFDIPAMGDAQFNALGQPEILFLMHPIGRDVETEQGDAQQVIEACLTTGPTLAMHPNRDAGWEGVTTAIDSSNVRWLTHLPRREFIGLLKRVRMIVGNSSAGLIECAVLGVPCVNVGSRQAGRERPANVIDVGQATHQDVTKALERASRAARPTHPEHPYGDGHTGRRVADLLSRVARAAGNLRKRNRY